jgi:hypothetical protein
VPIPFSPTLEDYLVPDEQQIREAILKLVQAQ